MWPSSKMTVECNNSNNNQRYVKINFTLDLRPKGYFFFNTSINVITVRCRWCNPWLRLCDSQSDWIFQFETNICIIYAGRDYLSEDCLTLNIFVPSNNYSEHKAVMLWIHGGAYQIGQSSIYSGENLAVYEDVIVVGNRCIIFCIHVSLKVKTFIC